MAEPILRDAAEKAREYAGRLEAAIDAIDCAMMPLDVVNRHTREVGGPVSGYRIIYDEDTVVQHVKDVVAERDYYLAHGAKAEAEVARLRAVLDAAKRLLDPHAPTEEEVDRG